MDERDPVLERWRLILGRTADVCVPGGLGAEAGARDDALDWLYERGEDLQRRGVHRTTGSGPSNVSPVEWLDDVHRLFPRETIERLERDAVERYDIHEIVTDPSLLERVEPNPTLLKAVLRTKHLMNPEVQCMARRLVARVVSDLVATMATEVRQAFAGSRSRERSLLRRANSFDFRRTVHENLRHYDPGARRLCVETSYFRARTRRHLRPWQVILLVDQSASMVGSVIHSAVTAACLWNLPGVRAHLVAFDTAVVDLTRDVDDPVELLMTVQLGGGTDIARAVGYAAGLIEQPRRTILAVVSDFYEGGDAAHLVRLVRGLVEQGTHVLGLAALDEEAAPDYDRDLAQRLADVGAHVGAMTPGELAAFIAERIGR